MVLLYGLVSMAYSHPSVRLKKYPYLSWLTAGIFQGAFTFLMCVIGFQATGIDLLLQTELLFPALFTTLLLLGSYPLTQVYQHEEDLKRGDITLSLRLGKIGTFYFASLWFLVAGAAFIWYFINIDKAWAIPWFLGATFPLVVYFLYWFSLVQKDQNLYTNHTMAMGMNQVSSTCLNFSLFIIFLPNKQYTLLLKRIKLLVNVTISLIISINGLVKKRYSLYCCKIKINLCPKIVS